VSPSRPMSRGHSVPGSAREAQPPAADFTNVTALSWPDAPRHPRYSSRTDVVRLRAALQDDLAGLDYRALARLSWLIGDVADAGAPVK
jgi:hypothetical protein